MRSASGPRPLRSGGLVLLALLAACGERGEGARGAVLRGDTVPVVPVPVPGSAPAEAVPSGSPAGQPAGAIGVRVEQPRPGRLVVNGATRAVPAVQVSVEDGERVLFGPADVPVRDGRFRIDLTHEPTGRPSVSVYVSDPEGRHQTVVPIARGAAAAAAGGAQPVLPVAGGGTAASAGPPLDGAAVLEAPGFRVRRPRAAPGDRQLRIEGRARPLRFFVAVSRRETALATEALALEGDSAAWKPFTVVLPVPGGLRQGDEVVITTGPGAGERGLVFQPLRP